LLAACVGHADVGEKKYKRLTRTLKPDLAAYARHKAALGAAAFPTADAVVHADMVRLEPSKVDALVTSMREQEATRQKAHKRRRFDPNADVDYINEGNARFNQKIARAFDPYTRDVRANLERGTAL
jgi:pre-mRNA-splicing factor SYF2